MLCDVMLSLLCVQWLTYDVLTSSLLCVQLTFNVPTSSFLCVQWLTYDVLTPVFAVCTVVDL